MSVTPEVDDIGYVAQILDAMERADKALKEIQCMATNVEYHNRGGDAAQEMVADAAKWLDAEVAVALARLKATYSAYTAAWDGDRSDYAHWLREADRRADLAPGGHGCDVVRLRGGVCRRSV
ncbi:hypothetical protein RHODGE_RHODGE_03307 [Rhodoplanes serenus]|uniref:Uncharacterized protein n=1 Tax=Rhodoplanes serenus TaxID=200615 RepID=A0A447CXP3_9BRAD|nr:hypothetical protein [Rhodoplanes serenus]VCU10121.1 hypothetical protein RHODGE_RHODGE_03307 [Rhodoplanes serenus]